MNHGQKGKGSKERIRTKERVVVRSRKENFLDSPSSFKARNGLRMKEEELKRKLLELE